jgi:hypothetical protein
MGNPETLLLLLALVLTLVVLAAVAVELKTLQVYQELPVAEAVKTVTLQEQVALHFLDLMVALLIPQMEAAEAAEPQV